MIASWRIHRPKYHRDGSPPFRDQLRSNMRRSKVSVRLVWVCAFVWRSRTNRLNKLAPSFVSRTISNFVSVARAVFVSAILIMKGLSARGPINKSDGAPLRHDGETKVRNARAVMVVELHKSASSRNCIIPLRRSARLLF
jgi:hypothetical protein